jgi:signal transduction histidine kinase
VNTLGSIPVGLAHFIHEITRPLTNLSLTVQLLAHRVAKSNGASDPLVPTMLQEMTGEIERMRCMISSVRSHVHSLWQTNIKFSSLDLRCLTNELLQNETAEFEALGIRVHPDFEAELPSIEANAELLKQALSSLLKNAIDAMPRGGNLTVRARAQEGGFVLLEMIDTGVGFPPGLDLFAPFVTSKPDGMGLGLTIASSIVNLHGGKMDCASQSGQGSTFRVFLPGTMKAGQAGETVRQQQSSA